MRPSGAVYPHELRVLAAADVLHQLHGDFAPGGRGLREALETLCLVLLHAQPLISMRPTMNMASASP